MRVRTTLRLLFVVFLSVVAAPLSKTKPNVSETTVAAHGSREQIQNAYANLPLAFVENQGQTDTRVRYYAQGSRYAFHLTRDEVVLSFVKGSGASSQALGSRIHLLASEAGAEEPASRGVALALRFLRANPRVIVEGEKQAPGEVNYFRGKDPAGWRTRLARYEQVVYRELWPGVDLRVREQAGELKYEFSVQPGARLADIQLAYDGSAGLMLDGQGGLLIETALGVLRDSPPVAYQEFDGKRVPVESGYVLTPNGADRAYGFAVGASYQPDQELIIDPVLDYSTFLGGASDDSGAGIAVDGSGNAYVVGTTQSLDFPTTAGAFDTALGATSNPLDVFVSKLNPNGSALIYSTYLGGGANDFGRAIAIDAAGNAYVTGQTTSRDFPTTGGAFITTTPQPPPLGSPNDAFVTKLNATGSALVYSTLLGGGQDIDDGLGIAVDGAGNAYVTGQTGSSDFPVTAGAFDTTSNGSFDAFVTKLNSTGSAPVYSTFLGGSDNELPSGVAVDSAGNAYVAGSTRSADFPTTPGAFDPIHNPGAFDTLFDVFVTKLNATGSALVYSTFLGGSNNDFGDALAIDAAGNAYLSGGTQSPEFPTTPGAFDTVFNGTSESFLIKLNPVGSALVYSTFLRGGGAAIAVDANNNVWVTGGAAADAPTTADAFSRVHGGGGSDVYVAELNATGSALVFATFLGGANSEGGSGIALDTVGNVYVTGRTLSANFPTTPSALDTVFRGDPAIFWGDGFAAKFGVGISPPPPSGPTLSAISVNPGTVVGGASSTGAVTLSAAAPAGGAVVALSDNSAVVTVPTSVTVAAGATSATFTVTTSSVTTPTTVSISGSSGGTTQSATLTVNPPAPAAPTLLAPANDARPAQPVTFDWTDVTAAASYEIQVDDSSTFSAPLVADQIVTPSQATIGGFASVRHWWRVRGINSAGIAGSWSAARRFIPQAAPAAPSLSAITLSPTSVVGSASAQGTATLTSAAPAGGAVVSLSSSNTAAASVPTGVTVPAGATSATFTVSTPAVTASTSSTISGSFGGATRSAVLTVTPAPAPGQTATLTVTATGRSGERVTSTPAGISVAVGTTGSAPFTTGTSITLTVSNGRDAIWSGACSSGGNKAKTCTFTLNAAASVTANVQ